MRYLRRDRGKDDICKNTIKEKANGWNVGRMLLKKNQMGHPNAPKRPLAVFFGFRSLDLIISGLDLVFSGLDLIISGLDLEFSGFDLIIYGLDLIISGLDSPFSGS
jgi:hypothetical protein